MQQFKRKHILYLLVCGFLVFYKKIYIKLNPCLLYNFRDENSLCISGR